MVEIVDGHLLGGLVEHGAGKPNEPFGLGAAV